MPHVTDDELLGWRETDQVQREEIARLRADMEVAIKRIAQLEALLREADNGTIWEMHMPDGQEFQRKVERALGIGKTG